MSILDTNGPSSLKNLRVPMQRLTTVEIRELIDTRAGIWLLAATVAVSAILAAVAAGSAQHINFANLFAVLNIPTTTFLPIIVILLVASEWCAAHAMTSFSLEPDRSRVIAAKALAGLCLTAAALLNALVFAVVGNLFAQLRTGAGDWSASLSLFRNAVLVQLAHMAQAMGFAMLIMNSAAAIAAFFVLPTLLTAIGSIIGWIYDHLQPWIDFTASLAPLNNGDAPFRSAHALTTTEWSQFAVATALRVVLPLILGRRRNLRCEIK